MSKQTFSIITYNIHKGFGVGRLRFLLPEMRQALNSLAPDFIFLQEVQGAHKRREKRINAWPDGHQAEFIADDGWPYHLYAKNAIYESGHHGNAILSQLPIDQFENINISKLTRASRSILHAQVAIKDKQGKDTVLHLLCVHMGLFKAERKEQIKAVIARILAAVPKEDPLIMAGDFNDWRHEITTPLEAELGIQEAFLEAEGAHARSFPALRPAFCVDRVYYRGVSVERVQCLTGKPWRTLSDHLPLYAQFSI